jgi:cytochrome c-type biogenesis protein CcmF
LSLSVCLFVFGTIILEFYRGTRARKATGGGTVLQAFSSLIRRNRRRYGGYIIHFGVVLIFVGITGSAAYQLEKDVVLRPGEQAQVGPFTLRYSDIRHAILPTHEAFIATVEVARGTQSVATLHPEKRIYFVQNQPTTEVALRTTLLEDLYVILAGFEPSKIATFRVFVNPLVSWMWIGGFIMVMGTVIAIWPERRPYGIGRQREGSAAMAVPSKGMPL